MSSPHQPPPRLRTRVTAAFAVLTAAAVAVVLYGAWVQWEALLFWSSGTAGLSDFDVYRQAAFSVLDQQPLYEGKRFITGDGNQYDWTYTPFGALLMTPLAWLPRVVADNAWITANLAALAVITWISFRALISRLTNHKPLVLLAFTFAMLTLAPVSEALGLGQLGILLIFGVLVDAVVLAERRSRWTGVLVGLGTAVKLTPGVFIVYWIITRQYRAALTATATILAAWSIAAVLLWQDSLQYFAGLRFLNLTGEIGDFTFSSWNQSLYAMIGRYTTAGYGLWLPIAAVLIAVTYTVAYRAWKHNNLLLAAANVGMMTVLVSPISWIHHAIWVIPALGAIVGDGRRLPFTAAALTLGFLATSPTRQQPFFNNYEIWGLSFVLLYIVTLITTLSSDDTGRQQETSPTHSRHTQPAAETPDT